MYYILLIIAVIIGQGFAAAYLIWKHQNGNELINYTTAAKLYVKKNIGTFVFILAFTLVLLFVLSDWMDMTLTKAELSSFTKRTKFQEAQLKFKTVATFYGIFAQGIASMFYKGGEVAIKNYGKKNGIDTDTNSAL